MCATSGHYLKGTGHALSTFPLLTGQSEDLVTSQHGHRDKGNLLGTVDQQDRKRDVNSFFCLFVQASDIWGLHYSTQFILSISEKVELQFPMIYRFILLILSTFVLCCLKLVISIYIFIITTSSWWNDPWLFWNVSLFISGITFFGLQICLILI